MDRRGAGCRRFLLGVLGVLAVHSLSSASPPTVRNVDRLGLQAGGTTTLTIDGDNLLPDPKLVLAVPVAKQTLRPGATANRIMLDITLDKSVVPGLYNLRLANAHGVSAGRVVAVDHLPQQAWSEKVTLPAALHGTLTGGRKLTTSFAGKAGQALTCEVAARRLGGQLRPVVHLYDEGGRQLGWARPAPTLGGDSRLTLTLPADGRYTVEVHDARYAGPGPGNIRLALGNWQYVDAVFPAAVRRGQPASVELIGNAPGQNARVQATGDGSFLPLPWANPSLAGGPRPWVIVSDLPEYVEKEGAAPQDAGTVPVALNGRLGKPGEADRFQLGVRPGDKLRFEVFADRLGSPMDAVLKLQRDNGALLAQADDSPAGADPVLDFTVPPGLTKLVAVVEDVHGRGRPNFVYRVVVQPLTPAVKDFRVLLADTELNVPIGGNRVVEVGVERAGFTGPLRFAFNSLPPGMQVQGADVPAGASGALLTLAGNGPAPATALTALSGTSADPTWKATRVAIQRTHPLRQRQPWLAEELAVALTPKETIAFAAAWGSLPADAKLVPGAALKVPLTVTLPKEPSGGVRLYLLSSHQTPRVNGQPDQNQSLRKEAGPFLELPAGKNQGSFDIYVPGTLTAVPRDLAFRADLLSKDRGRVIAQAYTPVRRFAVLNPLAVRLAAAQLQAPLDPAKGAEVKIQGKVERLAGFKGDVTVSMTGVPPGIAVPTAAVKAAATDFQLVLRFPPNFKPLELDKLQVFASGRYRPQSPLLNRSEDALVRVKLVPVAKPVKKK